MSKELKDYLHLYLGCEVETNIPGQYVHPYGCVKLEDLTPENLYRILDRIYINERNKQTWDEDSDHYCNLILRPLSDMTDEEVNQCEDAMWGSFPDPKTGDKEVFLKSFINDTSDYRPGYEITVAATNWFRKNGFDVDGLIDAGLAIDKTKQTVAK